jgi:hypothetical protein
MFCVLGESHADGVSVSVSVALRIWAVAGALHPHLRAIAQEQYWGERRCSSNHSITAGSYRRDARTGAPASRLNMQTEQQKCRNATGEQV